MIALMIVRMISVGMLFKEKYKPDHKEAIAQSELMLRAGTSSSQISLNSISSISWNGESLTVSGCTRVCARSSVTVIQLLELKSA